MLLYGSLLCKKIARAPGGHKRFMLTKLGGSEILGLWHYRPVKFRGFTTPDEFRYPRQVWARQTLVGERRPGATLYRSLEGVWVSPSILLIPILGLLGLAEGLAFLYSQSSHSQLSLAKN